MTLRIRWTTRAAGQMEEAALFLEQERDGFGVKFCDAVEQVLARVASAPQQFARAPNAPSNPRPIRRALVRRFGYWVIFEQHSDAVLILSVWHGRQDPDGWRQ